MISNSGHDENNKYKGGTAGDQGGEWAIIKWFNRPWDIVLRHPDEKVRKEIALLGRLAANNDKIGYDQYQRHSYWQALISAKYDPSKITVACEADCSSGVLANIKAVGYRLGIKELQEVDYTGYTGNMRRILTKAGFKVLSDAKYLTSDNYLLEGDILLNEVSHTATNLDNGKNSGKVAKETTTIGNVADGQAWLNSNYGNLIKTYTGSKLTVDNIYGSHSRWAALSVWKHMANKYYGGKLKPSSKYFSSSCIELAKTMIIKNGSVGTLTYIVQFILSAKGFYTDKMDAKYGKNTIKAVKDFQMSRGLYDDGIIGKYTWNELFK